MTQPRAKRRARSVEGSGASLASHVVAAPQLSSAARARETVAEWLASLQDADVALHGRLAALLAANTKLRTLLEALSESAPFLWDLASRDATRLVAILDSDPDAGFAALLVDAAAAMRTASSEAEAMQYLRRLKGGAALLIALADIGGVWPLQRVTQALTQLADTAIALALRFLLTRAIEDGKFRPLEASDPVVGCGYVVLAMGKMGAFELNYSSDIDLICVYDPEMPRLAEGVEAAPFYIRLTRSLARMLQERTVEGYVFRVDLRLRPDPGLTQIALSLPAALDYYESVGQNWERAAMIKARPCAGDAGVGEEFLCGVAPFVWRKYLDYVAVADVHAMKRQIHSYRGHDDLAVEGHNIKLGRGGIREIEFFVQTQQLIAGGRHPQLRGRETLAMLAALAEGGWISTQAQDELGAAYTFLRTIEHRLQMIADEQTHTLPVDREAMERFARFAGFKNREAFAAVLLTHLRTVQKHYGALFEDAPRQSADATLRFPPDKDDRETLDRLLAMGFKKPLEASSLIRHWPEAGYRALKSEMARGHLQDLVPLLVEHLARGEDPDAALLRFDRFLAGLHGGARLLSLLRQNTDLIALIARVLGTAPRLADILAQHPQVMDSLIDPSFFGALPDAAKLDADLAGALREASSYEDMLDRVRLFRQEQMFLVGTRILAGSLSARQAGETLARLAEVTIRALHGEVEKRFAETHGRLKDQLVAIVAMGKLGGHEMTAGSDLDLILIYDFDQEHPDSNGPRALYGGQYFARFTQRLIASLTVQTNYGVLYAVDMRLRPSGRSGPVATQIDGFASYQANEAWTWEHMALTRARVISAPAAFARRVETVIRDVLTAPRDAIIIVGDVVEMRRAIAQEKDDGNPWDLKYVRGGLVDIEFIAQYLQLVHAAAHPEILDQNTAAVLEKAARLDLLTAHQADVLRPAVRLFNNLTQVLRLCLSGPFEPKGAGRELRSLLARAADVPDFTTLEASLVETQARVRECFVEVLAASPEG
ncbi:MAG: bifunctional [glutamine synthetase] adenylyltransferase/[glutamine synthetase]-adenylyl-L-tyrosine phosphorylase [Variibacter sp.]